MNRPEEDRAKDLDRLLARHGNPSSERMNSAIDRVHERLRSEGEAQTEFTFEARQTGFRLGRISFAVAGAAVLVLSIALFGYLQFWNNVYAVVDSPAGSVSNAEPGERIKAGEIIRANNATAAIRLPDGSRAELRSETECFLERADDGIRINLVKGSLIVTAAKQQAGHLYVQTKDVIVSVVGTVFLVNAKEEGSRVAVIEGEVTVQQGADTKNLLPGELLSTNPRLDPLPVRAEVAWSPNAPQHVALLAQATTPPATRPAPPRLEFAATSIKQPVPGGGATGFACRGIDGIQRADAGESGNPGFPAPQGRCVGYGVSLARLIGFAYRVPHRYGPNTPDWANPYMNPPNERPRAATQFQIEAAADDPANVTVEQLRQMVQTMLATRFNLESHRETQEAPVYMLTIANSGIKFKEASGEEYLPPPDFSTLGSAGGPTLRGKSTMTKLAQFVTAFINPLGFVTGDLPSHVEDKTGLTGLYEYELVLPVPGGGARGENSASPVAAADTATRSFGWRAPAMADALEHQLGLRMQLQKVKTEVLVVDKVERPSEN